MKKHGEWKHPVGILGEAILGGTKAENYAELITDVKARSPEADYPKWRMTIPASRYVIAKQEEETTVRETTEAMCKGTEAGQKANVSMATTEQEDNGLRLQILCITYR